MINNIKNINFFLIMFLIIGSLTACDSASDKAARELLGEFDRVYNEVQAELKKEADRVINEKADELVEQAKQEIEQKKQELLDQVGLSESYSIKITLVQTGSNNCYEYVKAQRAANGLAMPYKSMGTCGEGLYDGSYNDNGSYTDPTGQVFSYGQTPQPGAIMLQSPNKTSIPCGHVSIVSEVFYNSNDSPLRFVVSEAGWAGVDDKEFIYNKLTGRYENNHGRRYDSFIY